MRPFFLNTEYVCLCIKETTTIQHAATKPDLFPTHTCIYIDHLWCKKQALSERYPLMSTHDEHPASSDAMGPLIFQIFNRK